jgi:hypothetical protein
MKRENQRIKRRNFLVLNFNRIKPEEVVNAYKETGLKPKQGRYFEEEGERICACGLGAIFDQKWGLPDGSDLSDHSTMDSYVGGILQEEYPNTYIIGFAMGFDQKIPAGDFYGKTENLKIQYETGYEDGKVAFETAIKEVSQ